MREACLAFQVMPWRLLISLSWKEKLILWTNHGWIFLLKGYGTAMTLQFKDSPPGLQSYSKLSLSQVYEQHEKTER